jgi:hypothetical protein
MTLFSPKDIKFVQKVIKRLMLSKFLLIHFCYVCLLAQKWLEKIKWFLAPHFVRLAQADEHFSEEHVLTIFSRSSTYALYNKNINPSLLVLIFERKKIICKLKSFLMPSYCKTFQQTMYYEEERTSTADAPVVDC